MSDTTASLGRKLRSAADLQSVVRTMKALAASNIGQYEQSVRALGDYLRTVELGLGACLRDGVPATRIAAPPAPARTRPPGMIVFGSDQGLVGQFNEVVANHALGRVPELSGEPQVWAVGERVHARLAEGGLGSMELLRVPSSVQAITSLVGQLLVETEAQLSAGEPAELHIFHNRPTSGASYEPVGQRLLPLDEVWRRKYFELAWPENVPPQVLGTGSATLRALIREYLFISLFRVCAESLASENSSRLAAMQRAAKNIDDLLEDLGGRFHSLRQNGIDEELFDVIAGFEAHTQNAPGSSGLDS